MNKVAVIGTGVMGSGIAAQLANSGTAVIWLDIVPEGARNRNILVESALLRMQYQSSTFFTLKNNALLITCGNLEDDLQLLHTADWIIEAAPEKRELKQQLYRIIDDVRKAGAILSSTTSTIPLKDLVAGLPEGLRRDMMVTHFLSPPRYTHLVEWVAEEENVPSHIHHLLEFIAVRLGKTLIRVQDTPGFIAGRMGVFWLVTALTKAMAMGISVEEADSLLGKPLGIPKSGVFRLMDMIGIDTISLMAESMLRHLPASDSLHQLYKEPLLIRRMITQGYSGDKGKGGFYRVLKKNGFSFKQVMDLAGGQYRLEHEVLLESRDSENIRGLVTFPDRGGEYAWQVMSHVLAYACQLVPDVAENIYQLDTAMKAGFNWRYGPFELIDQLGPAWFAEKLKQEKRPVPPLLARLGKGHFYRGRSYYTARAGNIQYAPIPYSREAWQLADITTGKTPVLANDSAELWDIGDGVLCCRLITPMNHLDSRVFALLEQSVQQMEKGFKALLIGSDNLHFSSGLALRQLLEYVHKHEYEAISALLTHGHAVFRELKYAPFPVVMAVSGRVQNAACEMALSVDAVQAHANTVMGLAQTEIGLLPGLGGCASLLFRRLSATDAPDERMNAVFQLFEQIAFARKTYSAEEARENFLLNDSSRISMNRARLLADAKQLCLSLAEGYNAPEKPAVHLEGSVIKAALGMMLYGLRQDKRIPPYEEKIFCQLANILSAGSIDVTQAVTEEQLYVLEHAAFMRLVTMEQAAQRMAYMLNTGRVLRN